MTDVLDRIEENINAQMGRAGKPGLGALGEFWQAHPTAHSILNALMFASQGIRPGPQSMPFRYGGMPNIPRRVFPDDTSNWRIHATEDVVPYVNRNIPDFPTRGGPVPPTPAEGGRIRIPREHGVMYDPNGVNPNIIVDRYRSEDVVGYANRLPDYPMPSKGPPNRPLVHGYDPRTVIDISRRYARGDSFEDIARDFNIDHPTLRNILAAGGRDTSTRPPPSRKGPPESEVGQLVQDHHSDKPDKPTTMGDVARFFSTNAPDYYQRLYHNQGRTAYLGYGPRQGVLPLQSRVNNRLSPAMRQEMYRFRFPMADAHRANPPNVTTTPEYPSRYFDTTGRIHRQLDPRIYGNETGSYSNWRVLEEQLRRQLGIPNNRATSAPVEPDPNQLNFFDLLGEPNAR